MAGRVGIAQRLQLGGGDETASGEGVRTHHGTRIKVITLVPSVVRHLMTPVRLHQAEEHGAELYRLRLRSHLDRTTLIWFGILRHETGT